MDKIILRSRLVLGTAQLGMPYGIANTTGKPDMATATKIISMALDNGIAEFDTAQAYGTSEEVLGSVFKRLGVSNRVKIISKLQPDLPWRNFRKIREALVRSLKNLGTNKLDGLMLHQEALLDIWDQGLGEVLLKCRDKEPWFRRIGVSVYSPQRAVQALENKHLEMVQIPSNILDRRFENIGVFKIARNSGKTVYVRSIFLQGLLLMNKENLCGVMKKAEPILKHIEDLSSKFGISRQHLAMGYAQYAYPDAKLVIGAETPRQVEENLTIWGRPYPLDIVSDIQQRFKHVDEKILNPSFWNATQ